MVVYVEYVLIENFALDLMLLYLSFHAAKVKFSYKKLLFSALLGALFALLSPFIDFSVFLSVLLRFLMGILLCLVPFPSLKSKKDGGRYALTCFYFFAFSFAFAGAIFAIYNGFSATETGYFIERAPLSLVLCLFVFLLLLCFQVIKKLYRKRTLSRYLYNCCILYNKRRVAALGFLDSGNLATRKGIPVCFVSPDLAYDLWEEELAFSKNGDQKTSGQVRDEIVIATLGGEKSLPLYKGGIEIQTDNGIFIRSEVYFASSPNIISREYKVLLHSCIFDEY